jgi:uncharacterized protein (TIGR02147 family)
MSVTLWNYVDYKKYVRSEIESSQPARGALVRLAQGAGCQPSYLSQVLSREVHLTPDHAYSLARFLKLSGDAARYFCLMVDFARASTLPLRDHIKEQMTELRSAYFDVGKRLERERPLLELHQALYYSSWLMGAAHIMTAIPEFQLVAQAARRLQVSEAVLVDALRQLEQMGLVKKNGQRWLYAGGDIHLAKESPLISLHHQNWRTRAVLAAREPNSSALHFSGIYAVGKEDLDRLKDIFLDALQRANKIAGPAPSEELICITCDVFRI